MPKYQKKPIVVEAVQWTGYNDNQLTAFIVGAEVPPDAPRPLGWPKPFYVQTLEGVMKANPGDWVIRGIKGEIYPCKADIFSATYEPVAHRREAAPRAKESKA